MDDVEKWERRGRITKLTDEVIDIIAASVAVGNNREVAASAAGVSARSLVSWLAQGRKDEVDKKETPYTDLLYEVEFAESKAESVMVNAVFKAAQSDAKYAVEWLQRARKHRWSQRVENTGADGGPQEVTVTNHAALASAHEKLRAAGIVIEG